MLETVLFDWGDTLMRWDFDLALLEAGHRAGLEQLGLEYDDRLTARFVDGYLPELWAPSMLEEVEYQALVRRLLGEFGIGPDDEALDRFLDAEHRAWAPARQLASTTHALLDPLRDRRLRPGPLSHAPDPPRALQRDLADFRTYGGALSAAPGRTG